MKITRKVVDEIIKQSQEELPYEACGYLGGNDGFVDRFYPMTNTDKSHEHFSFDIEEQYTVLRKAREDKLDLIAVFHSHPETPARPSKEDIRLAYDSQISYVIVSLAGDQPDIKSFKIKDGLVKPEELEIL